MKHTSKFCKKCDKQVLAVRTDVVNHILHLILSIFTVGFWIIIWLLLIIRDWVGSATGLSSWKCSFCGSALDSATKLVEKIDEKLN